MNRPNINDFLSDFDVPRDVLDYPSMTTAQEKKMLYSLARQYYQGDGLIIDAGLFLGASTNAFATGIKDNVDALGKLKENGLHPINAYDIALWNSSGFDKYLNDPLVVKALSGNKFQDGDNYFLILERLLSNHSDLIEFFIGDIIKLAHVPTGNHIEIAFYDCLKNYERDWAAFKAFAPSFVPGKTIVVQQDYFYEDALDNKIRQEFLSPFFEYLGAVDTSALFQLAAPIPKEFFSVDPVLSLTDEQSTLLLEAAADRIPDSAFKIYAEVAVVRHMIRKGNMEDASNRLSDIDRRAQSIIKLPPRPAKIIQHARDLLNQS